MYRVGVRVGVRSRDVPVLPCLSLEPIRPRGSGSFGAIMRVSLGSSLGAGQGGSHDSGLVL